MFITKYFEGSSRKLKPRHNDLDEKHKQFQLRLIFALFIKIKREKQIQKKLTTSRELKGLLMILFICKENNHIIRNLSR